MLHKKRAGERWKNLLYLLPFLMMITVFILIPVMEIFYGSLFAIKLNGTRQYVGLKNYAAAVSGSGFWQIGKNTLVWTAATVLLKNILGLLLALLMGQKFKGNKGFQIVSLLPWATPWMISSILFKWFFDGLYGYLNSFLYTTGIIARPIDWLGSQGFALWGVIIANVWTAIPFCGFIYLSVLSSIPRSLYEAAEMDGAEPLQKFRHITCPLLMPTVQLVGVLTTIWGINSFDMIYTMTDGGPSNASETLTTYIYRLGFRLNNTGQSYALSVLVFIAMTALVLLYIKMGRSNEEHG